MATEIVVSGRVQGVFFRDSCRRRAQELGVRGWVRNAEDGTVVGVFDGDPGAVEQLVAWCRQGPPLARVDQVQVSTTATTAEPGFTVR